MEQIQMIKQTMDLFDQSNCVDQTDQMDGVDMQKCQYYLFRCYSTQFYAINVSTKYIHNTSSYIDAT